MGFSIGDYPKSKIIQSKMGRVVPKIDMAVRYRRKGLQALPDIAEKLFLHFSTNSRIEDYYYMYHYNK